MADRARCKFRCETVEGGNQKTVKLRAHYDAELSKEDEAFSKYTPWGTLEMGIENPALDDFFKPGECYYLDLSRVE